MGLVMIRCPGTGRAVSTGIQAQRDTFRATPVFFSHMYCALCQTTHQWFAKDAWVCNSASGVCDPPCECQAA
jgi:hypothetical protein